MDISFNYKYKSFIVVRLLFYSVSKDELIDHSISLTHQYELTPI